MITLTMPTNDKQVTPFDRSAITGYIPSHRAQRRKQKQAQPFSSRRGKKPRQHPNMQRREKPIKRRKQVIVPDKYGVVIRLPQIERQRLDEKVKRGDLKAVA